MTPRHGVEDRRYPFVRSHEVVAAVLRTPEDERRSARERIERLGDRLDVDVRHVRADQHDVGEALREKMRERRGHSRAEIAVRLRKRSGAGSDVARESGIRRRERPVQRPTSIRTEPASEVGEKRAVDFGSGFRADGGGEAGLHRARPRIAGEHHESAAGRRKTRVHHGLMYVRIRSITPGSRLRLPKTTAARPAAEERSSS